MRGERIPGTPRYIEDEWQRALDGCDEHGIVGCMGPECGGREDEEDDG
jgi:hypothetical protein